MKLSTLIHCAITVASQAKASVAAGKYEYAALWFAYRMNVEAFNLGMTTMLIAPGCAGTVSDGSCYLDEFLDHIWDQRLSASSYGGKTGITVLDQSISVDDLAESIEVAGKSGGYFTPSKVSPAASPNAKGKITFLSSFKAVINNVQTMRTMSSADTSVIRFVDPIVDALEQTTVARIQDSLTDLQKALGEMMDAEGFEVVVKENGFLDPDATYATNSGESRDWKEALKKYVTANWAGDLEGVARVKKHMHVITNFQYFTSTTKGPVPC